MTAETIDSVAARAPDERRYGLAALLPFINAKRTHFILTVASGVLAQIATVVSAATGAWLVGHAVQGVGQDQLASAFWILGFAVLAAAACKYWQVFISHDFAYGLIEVLQVGIFDGLERTCSATISVRCSCRSRCLAPWRSSTR
jgi:ATP-binding cassette subfamily C protein CydC